MSSPYLNSRQAAAMLGISVETLRKWRYQGKLSFIRLGHRTVRFRDADIAALVRQRFVSIDGGRHA